MSKITSYTPLVTVQPDDVLPIVDIHDTTMASSGTTKKITASNLVNIDTNAADIQPVALTASAGATGKTADAGHVHPATGLLTKVADAGTNGVALINGTQTFCTWNTPNNSVLHPVIIVFTLVVGTTQVGGATGVTFTDPGGNVRSNFQLLAGAQTAGVHLMGFTTLLANPNTAVSVVQTSAQTGGAATAYAQLWAF